jgi:LPXTG-site transpeptidase (sortase) family protein
VDADSRGINNPMNSGQRNRQTLILGVVIAGMGLICLGGGVALLAWRILAPEDAVILPPGVSTPEMTPTPGILIRTIPPADLPANPALLVILPVSDLPTPTPTGVVFTPSSTPTPTNPPLTRTSSPTPTPTAAPTIAPITPTTTPARPTPSPAAPTGVPATATRAPTPTFAPTPTTTPTVPAAIPDRILINAIGLDAPVVPVGQHSLELDGRLFSQWDVPDERAAGWEQSSAPLGQIGNTVLDGHHNVYGEVFHHLVLLKPGDIVTLESHDQFYYYIVAQTMVLAEAGQPVEVRLANARWILPTGDERVTLITCWPYDSNTHRLVVIALPITELGDVAEIP